MTEKRTNAALAAIFAAAAVAALIWYAQVRIERIRQSDLSFDAILDDARSAATGRPIDDMGEMAGPEGSSGLPVLAETMPRFVGIEAWLNSPPLAADDLRGKVVLVDFWTYSCINCIRTLPYITAWHAKYADDGLVIVGVHTPEFAFEKDEGNVRKALARHGIAYPVALDNDYDTWNAYDNRYWPAKYLFDARGRLRYTHFGEGEYDVTERNIQLLLEEAGAEADSGTVEFGNAVDFSRIGTPETYVGYGRMRYFGSPEPVSPDAPAPYSAPGRPERNTYYLDGVWSVGPESATLEEAGGAIINRFYASNANLVMGTSGAEVRAEVVLDGAPVPEGARGADVFAADDRTWLLVSDERLYEIFRADGEYGDHVLELRFGAPGVSAYAYTFG